MLVRAGTFFARLDKAATDRAADGQAECFALLDTGECALEQRLCFFEGPEAQGVVAGIQEERRA